MKVFSIAKGFHRLNKKAPPELSQKEMERLRAIRLYKETQDLHVRPSPSLFRQNYSFTIS